MSTILNGKTFNQFLINFKRWSQLTENNFLSVEEKGMQQDVVVGINH